MTVRIDTLRNRLTATRELLAMVTSELEDLHVLAYERHVGARDVVVSGGEREWALDTHGNPKAREAYRWLGDAAIEACNNLADAAHSMIVILREGDLNTPRTRRILETEELAAAIESQARRTARGEYTPVRTQPQPDGSGIKHTVDRLRRERDQAQAMVGRLTRELEVARLPVSTSTRRADRLRWGSSTS